MADIRCPMCGKSASEELEICPFCQARLKPLIITSPGDEGSIIPGEEPVRKDTSELELVDPSISSPPEEVSIEPGEAPTKNNTSEFPAWLRKLRGEPRGKAPVEEHVDQEQSLSETSEPMEQEEFLGGIAESMEQEESLDEIVEPVDQEESQEQMQENPEITGTSETVEIEIPVNHVEEEVTDWLTGLEQTSQDEDETPAWLSNIKDMPQKEQLHAEPIDENAPKDDGNRLDSLRGGSPDQELEPDQEQAETPTEEPVFDEGIPDWMKKLQAEVDTQAAGSQPEEENNSEGGDGESYDWLNRLQAETQSNAASNENTAAGQVADTPDWLEKMSVEIPATSEEISPNESETPDWLRNLQSETQAFAEDSHPAEIESQAILQESQPSDSESLEWMQELQANTQDSTEDGKLESEIPDWLSDVEAEAPKLAEESVLLSSETPGETETPDWLKEIAAETPTVPAQERSLPNAETPDWLIAMGSELQDSTEPDSAADAVGELADFQLDQTPFESDELDELMPGDIEPVSLTGLNAESELRQQGTDERLQPEVDDQQPDSESMPDRLENIERTDTFSNETPDLILEEQFNDNESEALPSTEMPGWLKTLNTGDAGSQPDEEVLEIEPASDGLLPAELPSWVQDMRPVESMVADVGVSDKHLEQITEKAGPLAGLHGVLPATPGLGKLRKPLNYSIKLRVSDDQSLQADQLEQMLGVEAQAKSTTSMDRKLPQRILRWVVATLVFVVVALPVFSGKQNTPAPSIYPPELVAAREILFGLPPDSPVLLVFDYEPAYSGELEVTAAPMVDNLLFSGARLAILSTSPTGPTLAEHFLKTTQAQHNYQSGLQYANLGYLAGGASGVLSFALDPSKTIPLALGGKSPWQTPLLQDIQTLADFKAVIILTDNSDTARVWVEQTGSTLGETPLVMAISAQAEPMIRPYYDSKQIKGLVTGLAGGKAYEQALQLTGLGQQYWDSFSYGLFIAELIIIFGALWSIVSVWRNRKSVLEEEA